MNDNTTKSATLADLKSYILNRVFPEGEYEDLLKFPKYFEMETINACNARCIMCPLPESRRKPMSDELFHKISKEIIKHAEVVKRVSLYRDGEPLLDKNLSNRIRIFKENGIKRVGISTNVSLLGKMKAVEILNAGIDEVILSIDSLDKTIFESIRVGLKFKTVIKNALDFINLRNKIRPQTQIWIRMIRQKTNQHEWNDYEMYWKKRLAQTDRVNYRNIHNWGGQLEDADIPEKNTEKFAPCIALWSLMPIFSDGSVPLCNVDYQLEQKLGDLNHSSIKEIWTSTRLNQIRNLHLNNKKNTIEICKNCNAWEPPSDLRKISPNILA